MCRECPGTSAGPPCTLSALSEVLLIFLRRSFDLAKMMVEWREGFFALSDQEEELKPMLEKGVMYWVGRDQSLRPLLVIR